MYMCEVCRNEFEQPVVTFDDPSPAGVSLPSGSYRYESCPSCGSDRIGVASECPSCGEYHDRDGVLCADCAAELGSILDRIRTEFNLTKDDFEEAIANHFGW